MAFLAKVGLVAIGWVPVGAVPGKDCEQQLNQERLDAIASPFRTTFFGGAGDNDGTFGWDSTIELIHQQGDGAPWHLRYEGGVARWPYGSESIALILATRRFLGCSAGRPHHPELISGNERPDLPMHLLNKLRLWLEALSGGTWIVFQSVLGLMAGTGLTLIVNALARDQSWGTRLALGVGLVAGAILYFWIALVAARVRDRTFPRHPSTVLALQRELSAALAAENQLIAEHGVRTRKHRHEEGMAIFMRAIQRAISEQWSEARFGSSAQTEVVLMTKSLRDAQMTCASWAVRRPYTLAARENDPSVYSDTEAARMYREAERNRVGDRLIANTGKPGSNYEFLNQSETDRIRSTVLHPVYDPDSELIGVIVAHTNRPNVFRPEDGDFWTALLRLVEPHVARRIILARAEDWNGDPPW